MKDDDFQKDVDVFNEEEHSFTESVRKRLYFLLNIPYSEEFTIHLNKEIEEKELMIDFVCGVVHDEIKLFKALGQKL